MEVLKTEEPFIDDESTLLDVEGKESGKTLLSLTREDVSTEEESSVTVSDFKIKNEKSDEVSKDTENIFVDVEIEQNSNSPKDGSTSNDEVVDYSQHTSMKKEPSHEFQQTNTGLEVLSMTREDASPEEGPSFSVFGYEIQKENSNGMSKETENILVDVDVEQISDSTKGDSDDEVLDYSGNVDMSLKNEKEPEEDFQQVISGMCDPNPYVNNYSGKQFPGHYIVKTKSLVSKSTNYRSLNQSGDNIFDETLLRVNNQKLSNISHSEAMSYSNNVCDKELGKNHSPELNVKSYKKLYRCEECGKQLVSKSNLKIHLRIHVQDKPHSCNVCGKTFRSNSQLNRHEKVHTGEKPYSCLVCGKNFCTNSYIQEHMRIHTGEKPYSCVVCDKKFKTKSHLYTHEKMHTGEKPYNCLVCKKTFSRNTLLQEHMRIHTGEKPYICLVCGKEYGRNSHLKTHQRTHTGEKPYTCSVCGKNFLTNSSLKVHHRTHTGEKPYSCVVCGKGFLSNSHLKLHEKVHTVEKQYSCVECDKTFKTKSNLNTHKRTHTGEKPYNCLVCGKNFLINSSLKVHLRSHTGEKPYSCVVCNKGFQSNSNLKLHERIHTGEKPYSCVVCDKTFTRKSHLNRHEKIHSGEKNAVV